MDRKQIKREAPEGFGQSWLSCRAPYDALARNKELEQHAWTLLQHHPNPVVMDLGCGSGNNVLFLAERWPDVGTWLGIDHDESLISAASERCRQAHLAFQGLVADVLDLNQLLQSHQPDLVVANAVFDLFTADMMNALLKDLKEARIPMLTTLNYTSMSWGEPLADEAEIIGLYEAHMVRPRPSGNGLGPKAPELIMNTVKYLGGKTVMRDSVWDIPADDSAMLGHLLGFMGGSVPQMITPKSLQAPAITHWLKQRKLHPSSLRVTHQDILVTWE